jgi:hypothetical protein
MSVSFSMSIENTLVIEKEPKFFDRKEKIFLAAISHFYVN